MPIHGSQMCRSDRDSSHSILQPIRAMVSCDAVSLAAIEDSPLSDPAGLCWWTRRRRILNYRLSQELDGREGRMSIPCAVEAYLAFSIATEIACYYELERGRDSRLAGAPRLQLEFWFAPSISASISAEHASPILHSAPTRHRHSSSFQSPAPTFTKQQQPSRRAAPPSCLRAARRGPSRNGRWTLSASLARSTCCVLLFPCYSQFGSRGSLQQRREQLSWNRRWSSVPFRCLRARRKRDMVC